MNSNQSNQDNHALIRKAFPELILLDLLKLKLTGKWPAFLQYQQQRKIEEQRVQQLMGAGTDRQTAEQILATAHNERIVNTHTGEVRYTDPQQQAQHLQQQGFEQQAQAYLQQQGQAQGQVQTQMQQQPPTPIVETPPRREGIDEEALAAALNELEAVIGLQKVKNYIYELIDSIRLNLSLEADGVIEKDANKGAMHIMFTGNAGTGKTTIARIVGKIYAALGVVSKGQFIEAQRGDLVGAYQGHSAQQTNAIIESAMGGILFVDEAYALVNGENDQFGNEAVATLLIAMENYRHDLVVILAGYTKEMEKFLESNSGLKSRIPYNIEFPDYTPKEMFTILKHSLGVYSIGEGVEPYMLELFERKQIKGKNDSGNARLVRIELETAKRKQSARLKEQYGTIEAIPKDEKLILTKYDFGFTDDDNKAFDLEKELKKIVGNDGIKQLIRDLVAVQKTNKLRRDKGLMTSNHTQTLNMIFAGSPGTGKTSFARILAKALKEEGILKSNKVVEVARDGLVGTHVGQTAQKTLDVVHLALGGILFIDEAYALAGGGANDFGQEAIDTLVKAIEDYREDLIVIIAGYTEDMDKFLQANAGLTSRFPYRFEFKDYTLEELTKIAILMLSDSGLKIESREVIKLLQNALVPAVGDRTKGNGRHVRNVIDRLILNQAVRVSSLSNPTDKELMLITIDDVIKVNEGVLV